MTEVVGSDFIKPSSNIQTFKYKNDYATSPVDVGSMWHLDTAPADYDVNFMFPYQVKHLTSSNGGVRLVPLIPSLHAKKLYDRFREFPQVFKYLNYGPWTSLAEYLAFLEDKRRDSGLLFYIIYDLSLDFGFGEEQTPSAERDQDEFREERIAGVTSLLKSSTVERRTEIGHIAILPPFHRTHVQRQAQGLLIQSLMETDSFDVPSSSPVPASRAERVRRVQWHAFETNAPSIKAAEGLGMKREGVLRWDRALASNKGVDGVGLEPIDDSVKRGDAFGANVVCLSITWQDYFLDGGKQKIEALLSRPVNRKKVS